MYRKVPWSAEPLAAWETHENAWRASSRPTSPGWGPWTRQRSPGFGQGKLELAGLIVAHAFWSGLTPTDVPAAREALKHHHKQPVDTSV